jgi:anthranilate phosphoribosyltransferase
MIQEATEIISRGKDLDPGQMQAVMEEIMTARAETPQIISFLTALNAKGETVEELTAAVTVMRRHVTKIHADKEIVLDTCGTGGDRKGTFNISTAAAFVAAGSGISVAKHGNRCVSSRSGSADILEALGININITPERTEGCLNEVGIAFLFAQNLHPAMKHAMPARKQIGAKTMFNILGPLTNPAGASHQLLGVYDKRWARLLARVLANLGSRHALIVHGEDGLDEITTTAGTFVSEERGGKINDYEISPRDFGFPQASLKDLAGGSASDNAAVLLEVLKGKAGPQRDIVLLNAGAAVYAADKAESIAQGIELAKISLDSGRALKKLELLREYSNK